MALEKFNIIVNKPTTLPSHHFSVRPGGGGGPTVPPAAGVTRAPEDRRSPMKITNFDPSQDYHRLVREHSANRLFEVTLFMFENFVNEQSASTCIYSVLPVAYKNVPIDTVPNTNG
jgi:hypothetical protein